MSNVLVSSMSPMSPGNGGDPRPKRSRPARVALRTGLSERYGSQTRRCGQRVAAAATTEVGALMARELLVTSRVARLDDEDMGAGGGVEEAWAMSRWRPSNADEVRHLMVRESMNGVVGNPVGDRCLVPMQSTSRDASSLPLPVLATPCQGCLASSGPRRARQQRPAS
uniref:Uncharacterized protein n=1 Tax=Oryza meridionalis TaxID=40149 RepID=A0A0E0F0Z3_9ORYZ